MEPEQVKEGGVHAGESVRVQEAEDASTWGYNPVQG